MSYLEKAEKIESFRRKYHRARKSRKSELLDEFISIFGYERKYAIKVLSKKKSGRPCKGKKRGRKSKYNDPLFLKSLTKIWFLTDQMCSKLLKSAIPEWLPWYEKHYGEVNEDVRAKLLAISPATIDRVLSKTKSELGKGKSGTKPGKMLRNEIPISTHCWDTTVPGYLEVDTVALCGGSLMGNFVWCITAVDIATTWTEVRATWNKGAYGVVEQIKDIEKSLHFPILGFDCDNGSEFINNHLLRYFTNQERNALRVAFTRSRPYRKNDNAHVEQKNWSHVRQLLGYQRFGSQILVPLLNDLLANEYSLFKNHFCPSFKISQKMMIKTRHKRIYGDPITPYKRILQSTQVDDDTKHRLIELHKTLDPIKLKQKIEQKLRNIFSIRKQNNTKHESFFAA